jgi:hypothetical protein
MDLRDANEAALDRNRRWYGRHKTAISRRRHDRRRFTDWLKDVPCLDCGRIFAPCVMDFDHRPAARKHFSVSSWPFSNFGLDALQRELQGCDVVCANCHRLRTYGERRVVQ